MRLITYKDKLHFSYNGIPSVNYDVISVNMEGGLFEEILVSQGSITQVYSDVRKRALYVKKNMEPQSFTLYLAFLHGFTDEKLKKLVDWLYQGHYKALEFDGTTDKIVYCMPNGAAKLHHDGMGNGYVEIDMITNSPYVFGRDMHVTLDNAITHQFKYLGLPLPDARIEITALSDGDITISANGSALVIKGVKANEKITIYPNDEDIVSDIPNRTLYNNVVGDLSAMCIKNDYDNFLRFTNIKSGVVAMTPYFYM